VSLKPPTNKQGATPSAEIITPRRSLEKARFASYRKAIIGKELQSGSCKFPGTRLRIHRCILAKMRMLTDGIPKRRANNYFSK
jgi:hypothetical protein